VLSASRVGATLHWEKMQKKPLHCFSVRLLCRRRVLEANRRLEEARRAGGSDAVEIAADAIAGGAGNGDRCALQLTTLPAAESALAIPLHGLCAPSQLSYRARECSTPAPPVRWVKPVLLLLLKCLLGPDVGTTTCAPSA
jgi:hypothetical protein